MLSATHRRAISKWKSRITEVRSSCASGMMERASIRKFCRPKDAPATTVCLECASAPNASAGSWTYGLKPEQARRSS